MRLQKDGDGCFCGAKAASFAAEWKIRRARDTGSTQEIFGTPLVLLWYYFGTTLTVLSLSSHGQSECYKATTVVAFICFFIASTLKTRKKEKNEENQLHKAGNSGEVLLLSYSCYLSPFAKERSSGTGVLHRIDPWQGYG